MILDFCDFFIRIGYCNPACYTFLESLGPGEYNSTVFKNQDLEEYVECL